MRVMITAGPTREYLDDVRYISNASSGRMGYALAEAVLAAGHDVLLITGPVMIAPPTGCTVTNVETTDDLLRECRAAWEHCDGVIATAAVCDYRPKSRFPGKLAKTGVSLELELVETADVLADLPTNPENMKNALTLDSRFWADHRDELQKRFNAWLAQ